MASKNYQFRMSAEGFNSFAADLRTLAAAGGEGERAIQALIRSSPQLASAMDQASAKVEAASASMKAAGGHVGEFSRLFTAGGIIGAGMEAGREAIGRVVETLRALKDALPEAGDAFKLISARLQNSTGDAILAAGVYQQLLGLARQTGVSVEESAATFTRFKVAAADVGATNAQVVQLIGGIQKFGIISGLSTQEMTNGVRQLAQGLAAGRLQGQDLRAVLEDMPQLGQALARELGTSIGNLRKMGEEGKLTAENVFPALLRVVADVDQKFAQMPPNITRSMAGAKTALDAVLSQMDQANNISNRIAGTWDAIANHLDQFRRVHYPTALEAAQRDVANARAAANVTGGGGASGQAAEFAGIGSADEAAVQKWLREANARLREVEREQREIAAAERADASGARIAATRDRLDKEAETIREGLDKHYKITKEYKDRIAKLDELHGGGMADAEYGRLRGLADKEYAESLAKLAPAEIDLAQANEILAETMEKLRKKEDDRFQAIALSLDPYAAALKRQADALETLAAAETAYANSDGERGLSPERAAKLRTAANDNYTKEIEKLDKKTDDTARTFDHFFARATSGFEDAIVKGKSFGDVLKGLEQDVARLIIRLTIMDPLAKAASSAFQSSGGFGGIFSSIGNWFSSGTEQARPSPDFVGPMPADSGILSNFWPKFAMGGIMSSAGPLPLNRYAGGGIADRPQLAMFGEGSMPEAYVPLPDGRRIPVAMQGGGGMVINHHITVNVANSNTSAAELGIAVELAVRRSQDSFLKEINRGGKVAQQVGRRGRS